MEKGKKAKKESNNEPSSLYHYTTSDVITILFNAIINDNYTENQIPMLKFHASEVHYMNDRNENGLILNNLFLQSKNLQNKFASVRSKLHKVFVLSLAKSRDCLPMWLIYGDNRSGVALRFDFKKIKKHFVTENELKGNDFNDTEQIIKCNYKTKAEINICAKEFRDCFKEAIKNDLNENDLIDTINNIQVKATSIKNKYFEYESEYRLLKQTKELLFKNGKYGITMYQTIDIPLRALEEIIIGPSAYQDITKESLINLSTIIEQKFKIKINIKISSINIK